MGKKLLRFEGGVKANLPLPAVAGAIVLAVFCSQLTYPLFDIDLWWHLASGRQFLSTGTLQNFDPFSLAGADFAPEAMTVLNGYWLAQVIMYLFYLLAGEWGIVLWRALLLAAVPGALLFYGYRKGLLSPELLVTTALCSWTLTWFNGERPNLFTILFVALLAIVLNEAGYGKLSDDQGPFRYNLYRAVSAIPLMIVWANLHRGFMIGPALICIYLFAETGKFFLFKGMTSAGSLARLWGVLGVAIAASFCNPNGFVPYKTLLVAEGSAIQQKISEYQSPFVLFQDGFRIYPFFILALLAVALMIFCRRRVDLTEGAICLFLLVISCLAARYVPLFVGATALSIAKLLKQAPLANRMIIRVLLLVSLALPAGFAAWAGTQGYPNTLSSVLMPGRFPVGACDFLETNRFEGVLFNHLNWGGYLAWRGAPRWTTFIDGRIVNAKLFDEYTRILWLPDQAQGLLDQHEVDAIVMPRLNPYTGELYALTELMYASPKWALAFSDDTAMVLLRKGAFPRLDRFPELPKKRIYLDTYSEIERKLQGGDPSGNLGKARDIVAAHLAMGL